MMRGKGYREKAKVLIYNSQKQLRHNGEKKIRKTMVKDGLGYGGGNEILKGSRKKS